MGRIEWRYFISTQAANETEGYEFNTIYGGLIEI